MAEGLSSSMWFHVNTVRVACRQCQLQNIDNSSTIITFPLVTCHRGSLLSKRHRNVLHYTCKLHCEYAPLLDITSFWSAPLQLITDTPRLVMTLLCTGQLWGHCSLLHSNQPSEVGQTDKQTDKQMDAISLLCNATRLINIWEEQSH